MIWGITARPWSSRHALAEWGGRAKAIVWAAVPATTRLRRQPKASRTHHTLRKNPNASIILVLLL
jgi:hypothetical protein